MAVGIGVHVGESVGVGGKPVSVATRADWTVACSAVCVAVKSGAGVQVGERVGASVQVGSGVASGAPLASSVSSAWAVLVWAAIPNASATAACTVASTACWARARSTVAAGCSATLVTVASTAAWTVPI